MKKPRRRNLQSRAHSYAKEHFGGHGDVSPTHLRRIATGSYVHGYHDARKRLAELLGLDIHSATIIGPQAIPATNGREREARVFLAVQTYLMEHP